MKLIILIPAYNEEKTIYNVIKKIPSELNATTFVINDGSTDKTKEYAKKAGANIVNHKRNKGYGQAIISGFKKAIEVKPDIIVLIDGDGQHDPKEIKDLIKPIIKNQADFVIGSRFINKMDMPLFRRIAIKIITKIVYCITKVKITDSQSGFRAFSYNTVYNLNLKDTTMGASLEILFQVINKNYRVVEVPITCKYFGDNKRTNKVVFKQGLDLSKILIKNSFSKKDQK